MDFVQDTFMLYTVLGMFVTWAALVNSRHYRRASRWDRMKETLFCSALTAAVSIPVLDYFPMLPHSITMFIGATVGTIGYSGWTALLNNIMALGLSIGQRRMGGGSMSHSSPIVRQDDEDDDPPMPVKRRNKQ